MTHPASPHNAVTMPHKPSIDGLEDKWGQTWALQGTYTFDRSKTRAQIWSIDTPPPTASGALHIGHVFGYAQVDFMARYKRMAGFEVFYPMGWDDNGLPTERRVQNYYSVRGDATLPYIEGFEPPQHGDNSAGGKSPKMSDQLPISRANFIELCDILTVQDEKTFEEVFRRLGLSVDWDINYRTIDERSRATAQQAFLRNLDRGEAYQAEAPGLWDVTFQTAVAQAELEARDYPGHFHRIAFHTPDGTAVHIETTRPELLPSVVALIAHPDDERYADLFGTTVTSPLFGVEIPVLAHHLAEPGQRGRYRDVLHLRRPHRRSVVARAAAADPIDHPAQRTDPDRDAGVDRRRSRTGRLRRVRRADRLRRPDCDRERPACLGRP